MPISLHCTCSRWNTAVGSLSSSQPLYGASYTVNRTASKHKLGSLTASGGLELLFDNQKHIEVDVPCDGQLTVRQLLPWARQHLLKERPELFMKGDSVRPGILVLVNDCDWELSGMLESPLEEGYTVAFISTLHGG